MLIERELHKLLSHFTGLLSHFTVLSHFTGLYYHILRSVLSHFTGVTIVTFRGMIPFFELLSHFTDRQKGILLSRFTGHLM